LISSTADRKTASPEFEDGSQLNIRTALLDVVRDAEQSPGNLVTGTLQFLPTPHILFEVFLEVMTHEELQKLRERLLQASQQRPRSKVQGIVDRLLARVDTMLKTQQRPKQETISGRDKRGKAA
jgi:Tfp pilus assembly protein PilN